MENTWSFYDITTNKIFFEIDYQQIIARNTPFVDEDFPPNVASLISSPKSQRTYFKALYLSEISWKRPIEVFKSEYYFFFKVSPSRIVQGSLGDCYFLSAVSALAEYPERIKSIFITRTTNQAGCYALQVYISGYLQILVLDDFIPCKPKTNEPAFTKSVGEELWVILLEKAWAKANKNYENIEAGDPVEAFSFLTGAPSFQLYNGNDKKKIEENWQKLLLFDKNNYIICVSAGDSENSTPKDCENVGINTFHSYSVLSIRELDYNLTKLRFIQLRNPWGVQEWIGDWSNTSPLWTEELKKRVDYANKDKGTFFIEYKDFIKYFGSIVVCKYHDDYHSRSFIVFQELNSYKCFTFQVSKVTTGYIIIHQLEKRFMRENYKDYGYSKVSCLLARVDENKGLQSIGEGAERIQAQSIISVNLNPGTYVLYVRIDWNQKYVDQYCINTYASNDIVMHNMEYDDEVGLVSEILKSYCRNHEELLVPYNSHLKFIRTYFKWASGQGFAFRYFKHMPTRRAPNTIACLEYDSSFSGMILIYPSNNLPAILFIPSGSDEIVIFRIINHKEFLISEVLKLLSLSSDNPLASPTHSREEFSELISEVVLHSLSNSPIKSKTRSIQEEFIKSSTLIPQPMEEKKVVPSNLSKGNILSCDKGHKLFCYFRDYSNAKMPVAFSNIWFCGTCSFVACPTCFVGDSEKCKQCPLRISTEKVKSKTEQFLCNFCNIVYQRINGRLECLKCRFNLCLTCEDKIKTSYMQEKSPSIKY